MWGQVYRKVSHVSRVQALVKQGMYRKQENSHPGDLLVHSHLHPLHDPHSLCPPLFHDPGDRCVGGHCNQPNTTNRDGSSQRVSTVRYLVCQEQSFARMGQILEPSTNWVNREEANRSSNALSAYKEGKATPGIHKPRATRMGQGRP